MVEQARTRRQAATTLADELLEDIELGRLLPQNIVRKASRVARLLDDAEAVSWLSFEVAGYPNTKLAPDAWAAAKRSGRVRETEDGARASTSSLGAMQANVEAGKLRLAQAADPAVSVSSANPNQFVHAPAARNANERMNVAASITATQAQLDQVVGAVFSYVAGLHTELRFGAAVETAFEAVRADVDAAIHEVAPTAAEKFAAAFENCASDNPEHWAAAMATCRRLLHAVADALRPPGPDVNGRKMTEDKYINRLMDWISRHSESTSSKDLISAELNHLGERVDAVQVAGSKGAHAEVDKLEAARTVAGTYLLIGDILRLRPADDEPTSSTGPAEG